MNKVKGLIFDLDGVIAETASVHYQAWKQEVEKYGINFTKEQNIKLKGLPRIETLEGILKLNNSLEKFEKNEIIEIANNKNEVYKELLGKILKKGDWLPGIKDLLDKARKKELKLSIASSSYNAPKILETIGLIDYFDFIVNPGNVKAGKPAPDIFLQACEGIGIKPNEAIGFEDAIAGVKGLKDANIFTVAITHGEEADWSLSDLQYENTSKLDLEEILRRKNV